LVVSKSDVSNILSHLRRHLYNKQPNRAKETVYRGLFEICRGSFEQDTAVEQKAAGK
jgi:hypothetical protein